MVCCRIVTLVLCPSIPVILVTLISVNDDCLVQWIELVLLLSTCNRITDGSVKIFSSSWPFIWMCADVVHCL